MSSSSEGGDTDSDHSADVGNGRSAGSDYAGSDVGRGADSGYNAGRGAGRGSGRGGAGRGAGRGGRGAGRQRNGKFWRVINCPTTLTGTLPQLSEDVTDTGGSIQGENSSIPPVPPTISEKLVYLEPEFHLDGRYILKMRNNYGFIYGGAPDPARWFRSTFYDTNFKAVYKTWSELPKTVIEEWFAEFVSDDVFSKAFEVMISKRYKDIVNKMRVKWFEKKKRPVCMIGQVWEDWLAWWNSPEFKKISNKNKRNKKSANGEACVHTSGSLSLINLLDRMKKIHGEHVDELDALIAKHTRKGPGGELIWACKKHEKVFRQYKDIVRERAIAAGIDPDDTSSTRVTFEGKDWDDAVVAASEGKRTGNEIFGFGRGGRALLDLPTKNPHASSICQVPCISRSIREQELETEVDGLKGMMKQLLEKQEKDKQDRELERERDRQERERERQEQNQWLLQLLQRVPWGSQQPQQNQWAPGLMTGASGPFQPQLQNQWPLSMLSSLPPQQLPQQQMQLLQQPQSSASPTNNGRGGCGSEGGGGSRNESGGSNSCGSGAFAFGVGNGSLLEMLTDPNYGRAGSGKEGI